VEFTKKGEMDKSCTVSEYMVKSSRLGSNSLNPAQVKAVFIKDM